MTSFEDLAEASLESLGVPGVSAVADRLAAGWSSGAVLAETTSTEYACVNALLTAARNVPTADVVAFLRGLVRGYARHAALSTVEPVWTGPASHAVPVRSTAQALIDVINEARADLLLMTYSATPHPQVRTALARAAERGVSTCVVVETLTGAGSALNGAEPAAAFHALAGVTLWHWPSAARGVPSAKMHAKIAVADREVLLVSSANLTQSGVGQNIEAGVLVRGGDAPRRAAEHVAALCGLGVLQRLSGPERPPGPMGPWRSTAWQQKELARRAGLDDLIEGDE